MGPLSDQFEEHLEEIVKREYGRCNPFKAEVITLKAHCRDRIVEVFVVGKWRPMLNCLRTTTEIKSRDRLEKMKQHIRTNAGWNHIPELRNKPIEFMWE